ncbi:hypothetical protein ALMP_19970 [Streptomyces sp. A012304]|nr:hypothetical protein ALMP_19970 [Streptomyces sp. A012304]
MPWWKNLGSDAWPALLLHGMHQVVGWFDTSPYPDIKGISDKVSMGVEVSSLRIRRTFRGRGESRSGTLPLLLLPKGPP